MVLKEPYTSLTYDHIACIFNKNKEKWSWKKSKILSFCHVRAVLSKNGWNMQGIWPNWLPMFGHTLAMTHIYNLKYTSLRTYWLTNLSCVCPWSSAWSLTLLSLELNQLYARRSYLAAPTLLGNDATVNMGRWLSFSPSLWPVLVFYCHRRSKFSAATMSRIQISNTCCICLACW